MKIFSSEQVRACDSYTVQAAGITSLDLMERAATQCASWIKDNLPRESLFVILCGMGNNGGDGLALARILHYRGFGVRAFVLRMNDHPSRDCESNLARLQKVDRDIVSFIEPETFITELPPHIILIDAILGSGLSRPITGWLASFIDKINQLPNRKIAIDIPSGLPADTLADEESSVIRAHHTLSFQFYKRSFLHPESAAYTGRIHILEIGLDPGFIHSTHTQYQTLDKEQMVQAYKPRPDFAHKGNFGKVFLAGGSYGKMGSVTLSAQAALRAGAGLATVLLPETGYQVIQTVIPEAMCLTSGIKYLEKIEGWENATAIGIGPGMGTDRKTMQAFSAFLEACKEPIVADADALNIMALHPELISKLPKGSIITPHPKEFSRLFGENTNSLIQVDNARVQAMRYGLVIVLKGHHTAILNPDGECWYNMTGNPGMAKGGSGDVLTGIITGLLAQGYDTENAALLGVYLHGLAGDIAAREQGFETLLASDMVLQLGKAFRTLYQ